MLITRRRQEIIACFDLQAVAEARHATASAGYCCSDYNVTISPKTHRRQEIIARFDLQAVPEASDPRKRDKQPLLLPPTGELKAAKVGSASSHSHVTLLASLA